MRAPLSGGFLSFPPGPMTYVVLIGLVLVFTPVFWIRDRHYAWRTRHER